MEEKIKNETKKFTATKRSRRNARGRSRKRNKKLIKSQLFKLNDIKAK